MSVWLSVVVVGPLARANRLTLDLSLPFILSGAPGPGGEPVLRCGKPLMTSETNRYQFAVEVSSLMTGSFRMGLRSVSHGL